MMTTGMMSIFMVRSPIKKMAEKVRAEVTEKLYEKEMHNINTHVESISDIEIYILEVDVNQVTDIDLGGYVE